MEWAFALLVVALAAILIVIRGVLFAGILHLSWEGRAEPVTIFEGNTREGFKIVAALEAANIPHELRVGDAGRVTVQVMPKLKEEAEATANAVVGSASRPAADNGIV